MDLQIISNRLLELYKNIISEKPLSFSINQLKNAPLSTDNFNFHHAVASVYSSKIEGESIETGFLHQA